jgi:hypothetical protein
MAPDAKRDNYDPRLLLKVQSLTLALLNGSLSAISWLNKNFMRPIKA